MDRKPGVLFLLRWGDLHQRPQEDRWIKPWRSRDAQTISSWSLNIALVLRRQPAVFSNVRCPKAGVAQALLCQSWHLLVFCFSASVGQEVRLRRQISHSIWTAAGNRAAVACAQ